MSAVACVEDAQSAAMQRREALFALSALARPVHRNN